MELNNLQKKIVLITSGQPSLNPRLVKEADSLAAAGYKVIVLYAYWNDWGTAIDKNLLPLKKWAAICVGGDPEQKPFIYLLSRLIHKVSTFIAHASRSKYFTDFAIARGSYFLIHKARKCKADLYIGHNLGALPATVKAAKTNGKPCGFDAEDFHRYEESNDDNDPGVILKTHIENKYIPRVNYLTTSSPGIGAAYHKLFDDKLPVTLLNVFPTDHHIQAPLQTTIGTKLFWFSQTIDHGRGLYDCIDALLLVNKPGIELHLLGFASEESKKKIIDRAGCKITINFHQPVSPDDIISLAAQFDIGLALEDSIPFNRDICLTNKIFTYMQAGLAIIASDTNAQKTLIANYPETGKVYEKGNTKMLAAIIEHYCVDKEDLYAAKKASFAIARSTLNWEIESEKFLKVVKSVLAD